MIYYCARFAIVALFVRIWLEVPDLHGAITVGLCVVVLAAWAVSASMEQHTNEKRKKEKWQNILNNK